MKLRLSACAAAFALLSAGLAAHASTITNYTLSNVGLTFGVGGPADGTLNGTFTFNSSNNTLTAANIVASPGTAPGFSGGGFDFIFSGPGANSSIVTESSKLFEISANSGNDVLELSFTSALNGSGPDSIASGTYEDEVSGIGLRNIGTGYSATLASAVAPEPSSIVLLGTGLFSLGGLLRRRRA